jgi:hypothetical protein
MSDIFIAASILCLVGIQSLTATAQSMDDLDIQIHGYATQGFLYSNQNSWNTTDSENGSAGWTEAVVNLSAQPIPKLRIGVQVRYFLLGDLGNQITLDWAQADYKVNEKFGFRVGKVKSPIGLLNESQDIDPAQLWVLLPQSVYPLATRNTILAHYGGVVYGSVALGERFGKLEYRAFGGRRIVPADDGSFQSLLDLGITVPNGISGPTFGGTLRWNMPIHGLVAGASENSGLTSGEVTIQGYPGTLNVRQFRQTWYFGKFERSKVMVAGEYSRAQIASVLQIPGLFSLVARNDQRRFYGMASYKLSGKLSGGLYYSSFLDRQATYTSGRYQKDWAVSARYDFNPFLYAKAEQHWIDGTAIGLSITDNPDLQPTMRMILLKLGVSF